MILYKMENLGFKKGEAKPYESFNSVDEIIKYLRKIMKNNIDLFGYENRNI